MKPKFDKSTQSDASNEAVTEAMALWALQIGSAREQTEDAITSLAERFGGLVNKLTASVDASSAAVGQMAGEGQGISSVVASSEQELLGIVGALKVTLETRRTMLQEIAALAKVSGELKQMAEAVDQIARHTKLISINAAIEAAHAAEAGRGFAVVAKEVRSLATHTGDTVKHMSQRIESIASALASVLKSSEQLAAQDAKLVSNSEAAIQGVIERFHQTADGLASSAEVMQQESAGIRDEISEVLISLQFQDRVSQILAHVERYMGELGELLKEQAGGGKIDTSAWLASMVATYATMEQRANHAAVMGLDIDPNQNTSSKDDDITFF